jgi:hypothetical protein
VNKPPPSSPSAGPHVGSGVSAPPASSPAAAPAGKPIPQLVQELWDLVVLYAKQETLAPLQQIGRYLGFGIGGAILIANGVLFLALGLLRAMQEVFDAQPGGEHADDAVSVLPYVITIVAVAVVGFAVFKIGTSRKRATQLKGAA